MSFGIPPQREHHRRCGALPTANQSRKAANKQERAIEDAKAADAAQLAQAEAGANAARVADRRGAQGQPASPGAVDPMPAAHVRAWRRARHGPGRAAHWAPLMSDAAIVRRLGQLKTQRAPHEQVWRECFDYTYPLRGSGLNQDAIDAERGQSKQADILDSTGTDAAQLLASEIASGTTPANTLWFEYAVTGSSDDDAESRWFGDAAKTVWENIHASNYDSERLDAVLDAICGGWMVLYIDEDREAGGYAFERWPLAECYVAASKPGGLPDTVFREYTLTAEQAVAVFGEPK